MNGFGINSSSTVAVGNIKDAAAEARKILVQFNDNIFDLSTVVK